MHTLWRKPTPQPKKSLPRLQAKAQNLKEENTQIVRVKTQQNFLCYSIIVYYNRDPSFKDQPTKKIKNFPKLET